MGDYGNHQNLPTLPQLFPPPISQQTDIEMLGFRTAADQLRTLIVAVVVAEQLDPAHFQLVRQNQLPSESGFDRRRGLGHPIPASTNTKSNRT